MRTTKHKIPAPAFTKNGTETKELPDNFLVRGYEILVEGEIAVSGGSTSSSLVTDAPRGIVDRAKLIANGGTVLQDYTGSELAVFNEYMDGAEPYHVSPANLDTGGSPHSWAQRYLMPLALPRGDVTVPLGFRSLAFETWKELGYLPTWAFDQLDLELSYIGEDAISDETGDRTETLQNVTVEVRELYVISESLPAALRNPGVYALHQFERREFTVDAAGDDFRMELPRARGRSIARIVVWTDSDGSLVDTIVNELALEADGTIQIRKADSWSSIQAENQSLYGLADVQTGYAFLDFADDNDYGRLLDTDEFSKLELVGDVSTPGTTDKIHLLIEYLQAP